MLPNIEVNRIKQNNDIEESSTNGKFGRTFLFDFEKGDFILKDGKLVLGDDIQSIRVWIEKVIRTEKFKFKIYDNSTNNQYGVTIMDLIMGSRLPMSFIAAEIQRELTDVILKNPQILAIENFNIEKMKNILHVNFNVRLSDGRVFNKGVKLDGNSQ